MKHIKRIDIELTEGCTNSDGELVVETGIYKMSILYDERKIAEEEVRKYVMNNRENISHGKSDDERLVIMSTEMAERLRNMMKNE